MYFPYIIGFITIHAATKALCAPHGGAKLSSAITSTNTSDADTPELERRFWDPDAYVLHPPDSQQIPYPLIPQGTRIQINNGPPAPCVPLSNDVEIKDRRGHSSTGTLCRPAKMGQRGLDYSKLVKTYTTTMTRTPVPGGEASFRYFLPLDQAWEIYALNTMGLLDKWTFSIDPHSSRSQAHIGMATVKQLSALVQVHLKGIKGMPLRELLGRPGLIRPFDDYRKLAPAQRLRFLFGCKNALASEMAHYSTQGPSNLFNPGLNLGNVYFYYEGGLPLVQLPEWGWTKHRGPQQTDWTVTEGYAAFGPVIQNEVNRIFQVVESLVNRPDGGLDIPSRW